MWRQYQNNPCGKSIGDCAVRAVSVALGLTWYEAFDYLCDTARLMCDMPSADAVWGAVLSQNGFERRAISRAQTASDFCRDHPRGVYVLAFGGHVAAVRDGVLLDAWNSSNEVPLYYYSQR